MKKYLLTTLLVGAFSISYAGSGCGDKSSDSCDKDSSAQEFTQSSSLLAKSCGSCGGCGGDKSDKTEKSGKSGFEETSVIFAGSCDDDEDKKKCGSKSLISA
ncbi:MAG: hypothetical protein VXZ83_01445 [Verrucomicrobiota bacterium]|nr:hypothetical protein [Verrucomicrobiota bacterium]